jgi:hypothetical protein
MLVNVETLTSEYKAEATLTMTLMSFFKDIDDIKWLDADSNRSYIKKRKLKRKTQRSMKELRPVSTDSLNSKS